MKQCVAAAWTIFPFAKKLSTVGLEDRFEVIGQVGTQKVGYIGFYTGFRKPLIANYVSGCVGLDGVSVSRIGIDEIGVVG